MKTNYELPKFYICDPKKNTSCHGQTDMHCGVDCFCTTHKKYAKDPDKVLTPKEIDIMTELRRRSRNGGLIK